MKKHKPKLNKQRNPVAQHSWNRAGAGCHRDKSKYTRKDRSNNKLLSPPIAIENACFC